jgi:hypothetical protein
MRFTVVFEKPAENQLARICKGAPLGVFRKYTDDPLMVLYHVDLGNRMVRIIQVRRSK